MKRLISRFVIAFFFFAAIAGAQTYDGLTIPATHPRLLGFNSSTTLANAKTWLAAHPLTPGICDDNHAHNCVGTALKHLLTATDCTPAITWALNVAENESTYVATYDLGNAINDVGETPILIYDFCYDQMTAAQRSSFVSGWNTWAIPVNQAGCTLGLEGNLCWGPLRAAFDWGVASYGENTTVAQASLDQFFGKWADFLAHSASSSAGGGAGGVFQEGINYSKLVASDMVVPFATSKAMGRDLATETPWFKAMPFALIYSTLPVQTFTVDRGVTCWEVFPWNDGHTNCGTEDFLNNNSQISNVADVMSVVANEYAGVSVGQYARTWLNTLATQLPQTSFVAAIDTGSPAISYSALPLDYYAPGPGFFWARRAWDTSSTIVHWELNTPSEVGHIQPIAGTWQMWRGGRWLSRISTEYGSPGLTGYNSTGAAPNHDTTQALNGILINPDNQGCTAGVSCQGDGGEYWNGEIVSLAPLPQTSVVSPAQASRLESQSGYAYSAVDISGTYSYGGAIYPLWNNPAVNKVVREFVWVRDLETLVIFDRTLTNAVGSITAGNIKRTFLAHCEVNWTLVDANHATCVDGTQELALTTLLPATPNPAYHVTDESTCCSDPDAQYRLEVNDTPGTAQSYFAHVLQGMPASGGTKLTPTITDNGTSYTVTLDANHSITFVKGPTSSGGSITINGTAENFTSSVENISVTDAGPVWGTTSGPTLASIAVTPATASIQSGNTQQFTATCHYSDSSSSNCTETVAWSSSKTAVATISADGLASGVAGGSSTIKATFGSITGSSALTVTAPTVTGITITPANASIAAGSGTQQYAAQCSYSNNTSSDCTATVTWSSSNSSAAAISSSGLASGVAAGSTTITANSGSFTASGALTVIFPDKPVTLNSGLWAWMSGNSTAAGSSTPPGGAAPALGVPSSGTLPGGRNAFVSWTDGTGNLWLFGGDGFDSAGANGYLNDLWEFFPSIREWAWMAGRSTVPAANTGWPGVYGTLGTPAAGNSPGGREASASWTDKAGDLWLFGGAGYDSAGTNGNLNDLWKFVPSTQEWTWVSGSSTVPGTNSGQPGVYGTLGTAAAANIPGGRSGAIGWTGVDGTLWLFGGIGNDSKGSLGSLNDLWEFDPSTKEWAWMSGSSTVGSGGGQAGVYGSFGNPSPSVVPSGRTQAVSWVDSSGDLWLFGGKGYDSTGTLGYLNDLWEFNPSTRQWAWMGGSNTVGCAGCGTAGIYGTLGKADSVNSPGGRSQAVGWIDSNGNLWLFGGNGFDSNGTQGSLNDLWEFIPSTLEWAWMGGGNTVPAPKEGQPGVYGVAGVPAAGNAPGSRSATGGWTDGDGNLWLFGGTGFDSSGTDGNLNDLWVYQPSSGNLPAAMPSLSLAPGTYSGTQTVTITDATPGAIIYFTTNGATPTTSSSRYSGPITVSSTTTIEAIALATGYKASAEASATYTFASSFSIASLAGAATNVTVQPGSAATFSLVATPIGSSTFPAAISLTASGLPAGATATFTPNGIAAGQGTTNISLSIQTSSASASIVPGNSNWAVVLCLLFLPLAGIRRWRSWGDRFQMSRRLLAGICLIAGITIAISGCSGSVAQNNSGSGSGTSKPTPYNITVTAASGSVHQTTTVTVTVQ